MPMNDLILLFHFTPGWSSHGRLQMKHLYHAKCKLQKVQLQRRKALKAKEMDFSTNGQHPA
jgi:hypothetical protein